MTRGFTLRHEHSVGVFFRIHHMIQSSAIDEKSQLKINISHDESDNKSWMFQLKRWLWSPSFHNVPNVIFPQYHGSLNCIVVIFASGYLETILEDHDIHQHFTNT